MPLRRSPVLTPRALAARRANALKSTGPRTDAGKARSCLNALRHGRRARDLRAKIAHAGDSEAVFLLDWFHDRILQFWNPRNDRMWHYTIRLAGRVWCFMNGLSLRPREEPYPPDPIQGAEFTGRVNEGWETGGSRNQEPSPGSTPKRAVTFYQYGNSRRCPRRLRIAYKRGPGIQFVNPTPTRRRHVVMGWLPEFRYLPGPPPRAKRVRHVPGEPGSSQGGGALGLRVQELEVAKNQVRTKLECDQESAVYHDLRETPIGAVIEPSADCLGDGSEAEVSCRARTELLPHENTLAADDSSDFMGFGDGDVEIRQALHPLIALQWAKWRQARAAT
jgi:hypothetical protein